MAEAHPAGQGAITGVVLAGGLSSRLGHDKARVRMDDDKSMPDLLSRCASLLEGVCGKAVVVGRVVPGYECFLDEAPGHGPVGGITTALEKTGTACLVLSCDLPFMEPGVLCRLLDERGKRPDGALSTAYKQHDTGHIEALVAVYESGCLPYFRDCLERRLLKISRVVPEERQHFLFYSAEESLPFFNINYPADLEVARLMMRMLGPKLGS